MVKYKTVSRVIKDVEDWEMFDTLITKARNNKDIDFIAVQFFVTSQGNYTRMTAVIEYDNKKEVGDGKA